MEAQCTPEQLEFHALGRREIIAKFDGGPISSDGGGLLLREVEERTKLIERFARCFVDYRHPGLVEHTVEELVKQRVYGLALGYEDLNDHEELRHDRLLGLLVDKGDVLGGRRRCERDRGYALAGKSTLNRLELTAKASGGRDRYKRIELRSEAVDELLIERAIEAQGSAPESIVLDADATDHPLHGKQEGRFFHGYYREYCYLPLYIFWGEHLLCARLRRANVSASSGVVEELGRIVGRLRAQWPEVGIVVRGDSDFSHDGIMSWCEARGVDYVFGKARNNRLLGEIEEELAEAKGRYAETKQGSRVFKDFRYRTLESWSRERRVVGKAEHLAKGPNPRFVVTSLAPEHYEAQALYEALYCARGDMENRIKEQQLGLFADRNSAGTMWANQVRLYFSSLAYTLMVALRELGLVDTPFAHAQCETIRLKLFKLGARVRITTRKVWVSFSQSYPYVQTFYQVYRQLRAPPLVA